MTNLVAIDVIHVVSYRDDVTSGSCLIYIMGFF